MLHLWALGLLDLMWTAWRPLGELLDAWEVSERAEAGAESSSPDGVDPGYGDQSPEAAHDAGAYEHADLPKREPGAPEARSSRARLSTGGFGREGVFRMEGPARVFTSERAAIAAVKGQTPEPVRPGDVMVLIGRGPLGCGMEETYQVTAALKHLSWGKEVALVTDARFSGVSTGACIGHVGPEALAGGPIGRVRDGDRIRIVVDCVGLQGTLDLVGHDGVACTPEGGSVVLASRSAHPDLAPDPELPEDTRLWAALQQVSGGTWGGCVYDVATIVKRMGE